MKLKDLREEAGMTQKQLAERIGNVQRNISNWESGNSQPDLETVVKLAEVFGVTTDELLGRTGDISLPPYGYYFRDNTDYGDPMVNRITELAERLTHKQKQTLVAFLESITESSR